MPTALSTDLYEFTMAAGYYVVGETHPASFELWVRQLPPQRSYLVAAGLDQALGYLEGLRFRPSEIEYLRGCPALQNAPASFFDEYLSEFRFRGDVWAIPEGTPVFAGEPLLQVTASLPEAQLVETALLSTVLFQTMIASKARRVVDAAKGRAVIEFGTRRAHGTDAAALAARAAFLGGCSATSNVECGLRFGVPVSGTMAHSWVMTHEREEDAFRRYVEMYGAQAVLLIDTYDTLAGARKVVAEGLTPAAVRLDSGDIATLSRQVREILDAGGLRATQIFASGELDEHRVATLMAANAPIDGFGVGTALSTSQDAPSLSGVYKLVEIVREGRAVPVAKLSPEKRTYPGRKQVWRIVEQGTARRDVVGRADEEAPADGRPLLAPVMRDGRRVESVDSLATLQTRCQTLMDELPDAARRLAEPEAYPVQVSADLAALAAATMAGAAATTSPRSNRSRSG